MKYILELTHNERLILVFGLASVLESQITFAETDEPAADARGLLKRVVSLGIEANLPLPLESDGQKRAGVQGAGTRHDEQLPSGVSGRPQSSNEPQRATQEQIIWAKGYPGDHQNEIERQTVNVTDAERKDVNDKPRVIVTWQLQGRGFGKASAWDAGLFPFLTKHRGPKTLWLSRKGQYLNIVGVVA